MVCYINHHSNYICKSNIKGNIIQRVIQQHKMVNVLHFSTIKPCTNGLHVQTELLKSPLGGLKFELYEALLCNKLFLSLSHIHTVDDTPFLIHIPAPVLSLSLSFLCQAELSG